MKLVTFLLFILVVNGIFSQQTINGTIQHGGLTREYILYVPASYQSGTPVPLVFNFHGYTSTATDQMNYANFRPIADTANFNKQKVALSKNLATSYDYLGYYFLQKDMETECKAMYKKALEYDPTNKNAIEVLKSFKK